MQIYPATLADWPEIRQIYRAGILTNEATFNTVEDIPSGETWFAGKHDWSIIKAVNEDGVMLGWGVLSPVSKRRVYAGIAEDSVYVANAAKGQGVGGALLQHTITLSEQHGIWTIEAKIFPTNVPSVRLHEKYGFRIVGQRERIAKQHGIWRDVLLLERRSARRSERRSTLA